MVEQTTGKKFRFIPYRKQVIIDMCLMDQALPFQKDRFRHLCSMIASIYHFEFHKITETLKEMYAPIDPDADTRQLEGQPHRSDVELIDLLEDLLQKANYERISEDDLNQAMSASSIFKIRLHVDFDDFSEVLLFGRGESQRQETLTSWLGMFPKTIRFINYDRVVVYLRFKSDFKQEKDTLPYCRPDATLLKLFQNVPKADLEMLFPNTEIRMRMVDKLLIGIPAVVSGGIVLSTKLGASLVLLGSLFGFWLGISNQPVELNKAAVAVLFAGIAALSGYLWKQFNKFKNRKLLFMQTLTQNLYFKNLDNNAGVFHRVVDDAEEEECKEAILAYYFLLIIGKALSQSELDQTIESWMASKWNCQIDFEVDDALRKLQELGLVKNSNNKFTAVGIDEAIARLDRRWDEYFNEPAGSPS